MVFLVTFISQFSWQFLKLLFFFLILSEICISQSNMLSILIPELRNSINMDIPCSFFITWGELVDKLVVSAVHYLNKQIPAVIEVYMFWTKTQECESLQTILLQPDKAEIDLTPRCVTRSPIQPPPPVIRVTSATIRKWKRISGTLNQRNDFKWLR